MKKILYTLMLLCWLNGFLTAVNAIAATNSASTENMNHPGPTITAYIRRGEIKLPIFQVEHLRKGDKLLVNTNKDAKNQSDWLLVLALVSPVSNKVDAKKFDLAEPVNQASIDITSDDQVPILILAPQVRTMFGLHTSFSESATLIIDAIKSDPQRFVDLQKIDQINHAIALITATLDAVIQRQKPEQAVDAAKNLAARFGVNYVDPGCFKDTTVNTNCVATSIVSSADMIIPADDIWSAGGPNSSAAKVPTDLFASLKIVTEASTYLINKYGDNYDFAPSTGQRQGRSDTIQLLTSARFKNGDIKTAYVYVPSWYAGKSPEIHFEKNTVTCLIKGELKAQIKGLLPLTNYWHDWNLTLRESGTHAGSVIAQFDSLNFKPENGIFSFNASSTATAAPSGDSSSGDGSSSSSQFEFAMNGQGLDATLHGKFGFNNVNIAPFKMALPTNKPLLPQIIGLDGLIAGEHSKLGLAHSAEYACIEQMKILTDDKVLATSTDKLPSELNIDLSSIAPGPAVLEIEQYGVMTQRLPVVIQKHKAHIQKMVHFDLETDITVYGDNLDRIDAIQAGHAICHTSTTDGMATASGKRVFSCPTEISANTNLPARVTILHQDQQPASFDFPVTKMEARPHLIARDTDTIVTTMSAKGIQWNLRAEDKLITEDSELGMLLHAFSGYQLSKGAYVLQLKFADDPLTEKTPVTVPLMSDIAHNELRTRDPISFAHTQLPGIVNPVWYRIQHLPTGLAGDWQALNRSIVYFPQLTTPSCNAAGNGLLIHGNQLELIDWASNDLTHTSTTPPSGSNISTGLVRCDQGLCLGISKLGNDNKLNVKLHWIDDRLFTVTLNDALHCATNK